MVCTSAIATFFRENTDVRTPRVPTLAINRFRTGKWKKEKSYYISNVQRLKRETEIRIRKKERKKKKSNRKSSRLPFGKRRSWPSSSSTPSRISDINANYPRWERRNNACLIVSTVDWSCGPTVLLKDSIFTTSCPPSPLQKWKSSFLTRRSVYDQASIVFPLSLILEIREGEKRENDKGRATREGFVGARGIRNEIYYYKRERARECERERAKEVNATCNAIYYIQFFFIFIKCIREREREREDYRPWSVYIHTHATITLWINQLFDL